MILMQVLVVSLLMTLLGRLWYIQIYSGNKYRTEASDNRVRTVTTTAVRGQILDDMGRPFVSNRTSLVVSVDSSVVSRLKKAQRTALFTNLAAKLKTTAKSLEDRTSLCAKDNPVKPPVCWYGSPFQPIPVVNDVSEAVALSIMERTEDFPGVSADLQAVRQYDAPAGANAAHLLGYIGPVTADEVAATKNSAVPLGNSDEIGRSGLEAQYDSYLRGVPGEKTVSVDFGGRVTGQVGETAAQPGDNVVTNVDAKVQALLEQQLQAAIERARSQNDPTGKPYIADSASGVVMDVQTGQVVALASLPTYNPSVWVGGIAKPVYASLISKANNAPLTFRAIAGQYAPGSTFKVVSSSAMLDHGGYVDTPTYDCPASLQVGNAVKTNFEGEAPGIGTLTQAIEESCDTVFYKVAFDQWLADGGTKPSANPADLIIKEAEAWGIEKKTGIDLPGETAGSILTRAEKLKTWEDNRTEYCSRARNGYPEIATSDPVRAATLQEYAVENCAVSGGVYQAGDAVNTIIGQGTDLLSPIKMAQWYAAIANGGTLYQPQVAKAIVAADGTPVKVMKPVVEGKLPVTASTLAFLQNALTLVTSAPIGTGHTPFLGFPLTQIPVASKTGTAEVAGKQTTGWYASYAPANNPKYVVVMMVTQGGTGALTSGASVRAIYDQLLGVVNDVPTPNATILPGGNPPTTLPVVSKDGRIFPPGTKLPKSLIPTKTASPSPSSSGSSSPPATPASASSAAGPLRFGDNRRYPAGFS